MTQLELDQIQSLDVAIKSEVERSKQNVTRLQNLRTAIFKKCDHIWPNGQSAWHGGFIASSCDICFESDL